MIKSGTAISPNASGDDTSSGQQSLNEYRAKDIK